MPASLRWTSRCRSRGFTKTHASPSPTPSPQWQAIEALGRQVDGDLQAGDVRLTMGGEPTFVSIDDMDGDEWNIAAFGPTKRKLAGDLLKRLKNRFAPGALLHYGQGKWYPGEPLPRWALGCYWRLDGQPIWHDAALIADEAVAYGYTVGHAQTFVTRLAEHLNVSPAFAIPAYEDAWHYLMEEQRLPVNVDPLQKDLKDPEQRTTLARLLDRGLGKVAGYVLPLKAASRRPGRVYSTHSDMALRSLAAEAWPPVSAARRFAYRITLAARRRCRGSPRKTRKSSTNGTLLKRAVLSPSRTTVSVLRRNPRH